MSERHLPDDQSSTIDPYLITSVRQTLAEQGAALQNLSKQLDSGQYQRVLNLIMNCKGHVILSGMGKSGHVGRKMSAYWQDFSVEQILQSAVKNWTLTAVPESAIVNSTFSNASC